MSFVMVPVPEDRVLEVYALLAVPKGQNPDLAMGGEPWTPEELVQLYELSLPMERAVLDVLSDHPGSAVTVRELQKATGLDSSPDDSFKLNGHLGSLARRCRARFGKEWPIEVLDPRGGTYRMEAEIAACFSSVRPIRS